MNRSSDLARAVTLLELNRGRFVLAVLFGSMSLGASVALSATAAWLIARASQMPPVLDLSVAAVGVRAFGISRAVLRYAERLVSHDAALRGMAALRVQVYQRLAAGRVESIAGLRRGDVLARTGADVEAVGDVVVRAYLPIWIAALVSALSVAIVGFLLPSAGLVLALALLASAAGSMMLGGRAAAAAQRDHLQASAALSDATYTLLEGSADVAVSGRRAAARENLCTVENQIADADDRRSRILALAAGLDTAALAVATLGAILLGIPATVSGELSAVGLAVVVLTPLAAFEGTAMLRGAATQLARSRTAAGRIMQMLDAATPAPDTHAAGTDLRRGADLPRGAGLPRDAGEVIATDLSVGWPDGPAVLSGVNLRMRPGRALALVGRSGVGKTTLLYTLAGLLPPKAGSVTIDGRPVHQIDRQQLASFLTLTTEDAHIFDTTIVENLRVARRDLTEEEALAALRAAGLTQWLEGLPEGIHTMLGANAAAVSGGERRRLLLARALVSRSELMLLDEPGEHLDPRTADELIGDLLRGGDDHISRAHGTMVATHRLSALDAADEVIVLGHGGDGPAYVRLQGTHRDLIACDADYAWSARQENEETVP